MAAARRCELRHHPPSRRRSLSILPAAAFLLLVMQQGLESPQRMSRSSALLPPAAVVPRAALSRARVVSSPPRGSARKTPRLAVLAGTRGPRDPPGCCNPLPWSIGRTAATSVALPQVDGTAFSVGMNRQNLKKNYVSFKSKNLRN
jgi:hypothetical protein